MADYKLRIRLDKWDAVDLVYKIIFTFIRDAPPAKKKLLVFPEKEENYCDREYKDLKEFYAFNKPDKIIKDFRINKLSSPIVKHAFLSQRKKENTREFLSLSNLCVSLYYGEPVQIIEDTFKVFISYIGETNWGLLVAKPNIPLFQNRSEAMFGNTKWWLYRFAEEFGEKGISRSLLELNSFNKAELFSYYAEIHQKEHYSGRYYATEENPSFLSVDLKLVETNNLDFKIVIHFGKGFPSIAFASIRAIGDEFIYSAPCILIRKGEENLKFQTFYSFKSNPEIAVGKNDPEIPIGVREYFDPLFQHIHIITSKNSDPDAFEKTWLWESKNLAKIIEKDLQAFKKRRGLK